MEIESSWKVEMKLKDNGVFDCFDQQYFIPVDQSLDLRLNISFFRFAKFYKLLQIIGK